MSETPHAQSTVVRHLPGHAADLVAAVALLMVLLVIGMSDGTVTATTVVVLASFALGVRGLAGLAAAWMVDNW